MKKKITHAIMTVTVVLALALDGNATTLTGVLNDQCNPEGNSIQVNFWNTYPGDFVWNLFVTVNSGATGPFINGPVTGPADTNAILISVDLSALGIYTVVMHTTSPGPIQHSSINLFFNGDNVTPRISAKTPTDTYAMFSANSTNNNSYPLAPTGFNDVRPVAGTLSFVDGTNEVTLIDYRWYNPNHADTDLPTGDRVSSFTGDADAVNDMRGLFTLEVKPIGSSLSIIATATNSVVVFWPSPSSGFLLYQNSNLVSTNWTLVTPPPMDDGTNKWIVVNSPTNSRYYRLIKP